MITNKPLVLLIAFTGLMLTLSQLGRSFYAAAAAINAPVQTSPARYPAVNLAHRYGPTTK